MGHEGHEHSHVHEHESSHEHSPSHEAAANPREELAALMRYMVGHNASHIDELANLAEQLNTIGEAGAYDPHSARNRAVPAWKRASAGSSR